MDQPGEWCWATSQTPASWRKVPSEAAVARVPQIQVQYWGGMRELCPHWTSGMRIWDGDGMPVFRSNWALSHTYCICRSSWSGHWPQIYSWSSLGELNKWHFPFLVYSPLLHMVFHRCWGRRVPFSKHVDHYLWEARQWVSLLWCWNIWPD